MFTHCHSQQKPRITQAGDNLSVYFESLLTTFAPQLNRARYENTIFVTRWSAYFSSLLEKCSGGVPLLKEK